MQNKKGFTLIELMIVVAIIAILAMIAVPMYQSYMERARNASAQSLLHQVSLAEAAYSVDNSGAFAVGDSAAADKTIDVLNLLTPYGFRPDPNVAVAILKSKVTTQNGYQAFAANVIVGSTVFVYDEVAGSGAQVADDKSGIPASFSAFKMTVDTEGKVTLTENFLIEAKAETGKTGKVTKSTKK